MSTTTTTTSDASGKKNEWENKEIGALWRREKQSTKEKYLVGTLNLKPLGFDKDVPVIVFTNKRKNKDTHPDLRVYLSEPKTGGKPAAAAAPKAAPAAAVPAPEPDLI
jgi:uncharacterized protein (DUF736 family)